MYLFLTFIVLFFIFGLQKYFDSKEQKQLAQRLELNEQLILDDIENTSNKVGKELGNTITFSRNDYFLVSSTPTSSALRYRFPFLIKDELDNEELLYLKKNLEIEFDKRLKQNFHFYSQTQDVSVYFMFNNQITKREQLNYLDLDIIFYRNQEELRQLLEGR
ncbi:hypothetical protein HO944_07795 [Streptococcus suis]|uniref:Uncharacterized protein n=1 Tax=Streptococcus suis TaxID=1307 RepID=A0A0Z8RSG6_STRSU|nr:hypothetical protein [Streptococcus suis]NQG66425.1 hypothetical protein [Streptococcus suis]NQG68438.1 hypothetical protein [Streptococcus suis]NQH52577.1 hypothetical protein [Streptococcus suis]NQM32345.1 hypothetical protein [Streptococcus suis]NQO81111.1 hypothetical protein [Streptococcus suis]